MLFTRQRFFQLGVYYNLFVFFVLACALYFWPAIKHYGIHKKVKTTVEPFYMPFLVQWQHNRTKRQRDTVKKGRRHLKFDL